MSNIKSFADIKKEQEKNDKEQEYYAGGNDNRGGGSGQATLGPPKARGDIFDSIVSKAHEGSQNRPHKEEDEEENMYTVTMWQNGFQVNDGPFRSNDDENSKKFIAELENGHVPAEIRNEMKHRNALASFSLVDKRDTDYVPPPPPAYVAFSSGTALGASNSNAFVITPEIIASNNVAPNVIDSEPNTTLQFRTIDGRRLRIRLNNTATIMELIAAANAQGVGNDPYILSAGFPPKDITDTTLTLTQADLIGAAIMQKKA